MVQMWVRTARIQRWREREEARVSHCQVLPDLEVKVAANLSIICEGDARESQPT